MDDARSPETREWRRNPLAGWLSPIGANELVAIANGDNPEPRHYTVVAIQRAHEVRTASRSAKTFIEPSADMIRGRVLDARQMCLASSGIVLHPLGATPVTSLVLELPDGLAVVMARDHLDATAGSTIELKSDQYVGLSPAHYDLLLEKPT